MNKLKLLLAMLSIGHIGAQGDGVAQVLDTAPTACSCGGTCDACVLGVDSVDESNVDSVDESNVDSVDGQPSYTNVPGESDSDAPEAFDIDDPVDAQPSA